MFRGIFYNYFLSITWCCHDGVPHRIKPRGIKPCWGTPRESPSATSETLAHKKTLDLSRVLVVVETLMLILSKVP